AESAPVITWNWNRQRWPFFCSSGWRYDLDSYRAVRQTESRLGSQAHLDPVPCADARVYADGVCGRAPHEAGPDDQTRRAWKQGAASEARSRLQRSRQWQSERHDERDRDFAAGWKTARRLCEIRAQGQAESD